MSLTAAPVSTLLQPATVLVGGPRLRVRFDDEGELEVTPAFALPYLAQVGDRLLIAGDPASTCYAIGVLVHAGAACWQLPDGAELRGGGHLRLTGRSLAVQAEQEIELHAPEIRCEAGRLQFLTRRLITRAADYYRWVSGSVHDVLSRRRTRVEHDDRTQAGSIDLRATGNVDVDGKSINLG